MSGFNMLEPLLFVCVPPSSTVSPGHDLTNVKDVALVLAPILTALVTS
jgi:hypothetical protein